MLRPFISLIIKQEQHFWFCLLCCAFSASLRSRKSAFRENGRSSTLSIKADARVLLSSVLTKEKRASVQFRVPSSLIIKERRERKLQRKRLPANYKLFFFLLVCKVSFLLSTNVGFVSIKLRRGSLKKFFYDWESQFLLSDLLEREN